jgi:DNA mismatch repair protein MutS
LRKVLPGGSDKSYGIEVGRLAGLPLEIIQRAKAILQELSPPQGAGVPVLLGRETSQTSLPDDEREMNPHPSLANPIIEKLRSLDPNTMTPIQAIQILSYLSEEAKKFGLI